MPTNLTNFRASECRTELVRVMPRAAENVKEIYTNLCFAFFNGDLYGRTNHTNAISRLVKIRATEQVAIITENNEFV